MLGLGNSLSRGGVLSALSPIANTYSLDFDGSNDYVDVGTAYNGVKSISFLLKVDDVTSNTDYILGLDNTDYISVVDGTVTLNGFSGGTNTIYVDGDVASTVDTSWHHILITSTTARNASNCDLGRTQSNDSYNMVGNLDEVAFTSDVKSPSDFADGTTPFDISGLSNLQNWWRMGDGTLDDGNIAGNGLIADQTNATLGDELISDGDFALTGTQAESTTGTYWNTPAQWTIASGKAIFADAGSGAFNLVQPATKMQDTDGLEGDATYKMTFDISDVTESGDKAYMIVKASGGESLYKPNGAYVAYSNGSHTVYIVVPSAADGDGLILGAHTNSASSWKITNISLKQVNGNAGLMTNMASDDIVEDTP